jgi:hypothetical protein
VADIAAATISSSTASIAAINSALAEECVGGDGEHGVGTVTLHVEAAASQR